MAERITELMDHYQKSTQVMETRLSRQNGWNDSIDAYMSKLPANWPYMSRVTDPRIRTTILEKSGRLLNSKLQGRLVPRDGGDVVGALINNTLLDFQWDNADEGGAMLEKVSQADQNTRIFGVANALVYWDKKRKTNDIKIIDPRDVLYDGAATHIKNSNWVQIREFTTVKKLREQGFKIDDKDVVKSDRRDNRYISQVKQNRDLEDSVGDDPSNVVVEIINEWTDEKETVFSPRMKKIFKDGKNPYYKVNADEKREGFIPVAQLRYYPIVDDIVGESEVEPVISLSRGINAVLCGFVDQMNMSMRPPVRMLSGGARQETIEYGPGAIWIETSPGAVTTVDNIGDSAIKAFNNTYPAMVAAFNTAMGDQSLGVSNFLGKAEDKTATEVNDLQQQQNNRDQFNQLFLGEFLKDIMMMWLANNKQYAFADGARNMILKVVGREKLQEFQKLGLDNAEVPDEALQEVGGMIAQNPEAEIDLESALQGLEVPENGVVTEVDEGGVPTEVEKRLTVSDDGSMGDLLVEQNDLDGLYDYTPDVKSMAIGAGKAMQEAKKLALQSAKEFQQELAQEGKTLKASDLLISVFEDAGLKDADQYFDDLQPEAGQAPGQIQGQEVQPLQGGAPPPQGVPLGV